MTYDYNLLKTKLNEQKKKEKKKEAKLAKIVKYDWWPLKQQQQTSSPHNALAGAETTEPLVVE